MYIYVYVYMYVHVCMHAYIYIYIYIVIITGSSDRVILYSRYKAYCTERPKHKSQ